MCNQPNTVPVICRYTFALRRAEIVITSRLYCKGEYCIYVSKKNIRCSTVCIQFIFRFIEPYIGSKSMFSTRNWLLCCERYIFVKLGVTCHIIYSYPYKLSGSVQCIIYRSKVCTQGIINCVEYSCSRGSIKMGEMNDTLCIYSTSKMNT